MMRWVSVETKVSPSVDIAFDRTAYEDRGESDLLEHFGKRKGIIHPAMLFTGSIKPTGLESPVIPSKQALDEPLAHSTSPNAQRRARAWSIRDGLVGAIQRCYDETHLGTAAFLRIGAPCGFRIA